MKASVAAKYQLKDVIGLPLKDEDSLLDESSTRNETLDAVKAFYKELTTDDVIIEVG